MSSEDVQDRVGARLLVELLLEVEALRRTMADISRTNPDVRMAYQKNYRETNHLYYAANFNGGLGGVLREFGSSAVARDESNPLCVREARVLSRLGESEEEIEEFREGARRRQYWTWLAGVAHSYALPWSA
jgi:hypothetical protein